MTLRTPLALAALLAASAALFAGLTVSQRHGDRARQAASHAFAQAAKDVCTATKSAIGKPQDARQWAGQAALRTGAGRLGALPPPKNVHRALARVVLPWNRAADALASSGLGSKAYDMELKQSVPAANLLNVGACASVLPRS